MSLALTAPDGDIADDEKECANRIEAGVDVW
jgi:hypothetical protein